MQRVKANCLLCGSTGPHTTLIVREMMYGTRDEFEYLVCASCESLQLLNQLEGEDLHRYYPECYYSYQAPARSRYRRWLGRARDRSQLNLGGGAIGAMLVKIRPEATMKILRDLSISRRTRILDVGCGSGDLLERLGQSGLCNLLGADPFISSDLTTPSGVRVLRKRLDEVNGEFDLIMFNHSLEHVPDPVSTLKDARERLALGGKCLVRLPTTSSEAWDTYKQYWVQIDAPRHMTVPSRKGLTYAARQAGFEIEKTVDDSTAFQFYGSELYMRDNSFIDPLAVFDKRQMKAWASRSKVLNRQSRGDQAAFVLCTG